MDFIDIVYRVEQFNRINAYDLAKVIIEENPDIKDVDDLMDEFYEDPYVYLKEVCDVPIEADIDLDELYSNEDTIKESIEDCLKDD